MKKQTSIFNLNADKNLSAFRKILYLFFNFLNNLFPNFFVDSKIKIKKFKGQKETIVNDKLFSPSRLYSELFWKNVDWKSISNKLNGISMLDFGCGNGDYSKKFINWCGDSLQSYLGVDLKKGKKWETISKENSNIAFVSDDYLNINKILQKNDINVIISQSVIEHLQYDLLFFKKISDYINESKKEFYQIHLFPTAPCLWLYRFHGFRQYTPRNISKITKLFPENTEFTLYKLGGKACNRVHFKYISWPYLWRNLFSRKPGEDLRYTKSDEYKEDLEKAIKLDNISKSKKASFYALVIVSNLDNI